MIYSLKIKELEKLFHHDRINFSTIFHNFLIAFPLIKAWKYFHLTNSSHAEIKTTVMLSSHCSRCENRWSSHWCDSSRWFSYFFGTLLTLVIRLIATIWRWWWVDRAIWRWHGWFCCRCCVWVMERERKVNLIIRKNYFLNFQTFGNYGLIITHLLTLKMKKSSHQSHLGVFCSHWINLHSSFMKLNFPLFKMREEFQKHFTSLFN